MQVDFESLAAEAAGIRDNTPLAKGAQRKKILYPADFRGRVARAFHKSGLPLDACAKQLGLSRSAVEKWSGAGRGDGRPSFVPVEMGGVELTGLAISAKKVAQPVRSAPGAALPVTLVMRETRVELPSGIEAHRLAEIVAALRVGGQTC